MATTSLKLVKLTPTVGAEVLDVDRDRLVHDPDLTSALDRALEEHGVLVFKGLDLDDATQVGFARTLGELVTFPGSAVPEISVISLDPEKNPMADYLEATVHWHMDGTGDAIPARATL